MTRMDRVRMLRAQALRQRRRASQYPPRSWDSRHLMRRADETLREAEAVLWEDPR